MKSPQKSPRLCRLELELARYKKAVMDLIECVGYGPRTASPHSSEPCKYVWMVHGSNPCDIRRYAYSHQEAVDQVDHAFKRNAWGTEGWTLYKLVRVNKHKALSKSTTPRRDGGRGRHARD